MKITRPGNMPGPSREWWVGVIMECSACKAKIELEEGDDKPRLDYPKRQLDMPPFITVHSAGVIADYVDAVCPTRGCGTGIVSVRRD